MAINFDEMLDTKASDVERPIPVPQGTYVAIVSKLPSQDKIGKDERYMKVSYPMRLVEPTEDCQDEVTEWGGNVANEMLTKDFIFDLEDEVAYKKAEYNMTRFLTEHLGLDEDLSLRELMNQSVNAQCLLTVTHQADKNDPETIYTRAGRTAPLE